MTPIDTYIADAPIERREALTRLRDILREILIPLGYEERMNYGMIGYVVPFSLYPAGYHCDTSLPVPFVALANQKSGIHLYHMGIYADEALFKWWQDAYTKADIGKLDMGKSCIRFKKIETIPYGLVEELMKKIPVAEWIRLYENTYKNR